MPTKEKVLERKKEVSDRISTQVRTLAVSFLALVWLLLFPGKDGTPVFPHSPSRYLLLLGGITALMAMVADFVQYVMSYHVVVRTFAAPIPHKENPEEKYAYDNGTLAYRSQDYFFYAKQILLALSALLLAIAFVGALWGRPDAQQKDAAVQNLSGKSKEVAPEFIGPPSGSCCCCSSNSAGDIAAIRKTVDAYVSRPPDILDMSGPGTHVIAAPGTSRIEGALGWWLLVPGALAVAGFVLLLRGGAVSKAVGASLLTVGTLSGGGFALVKELKIDSVFKVDFDKLFDRLSIEQRQHEIPGPERLGFIERFVKGDSATIESAGREPAPAADAQAVTDITRHWLRGRSEGKNAVLLVIGATDRLPVRRAAGRQFEANVGLAQARAEGIKRAIIAKCKSIDSTCDLKEEQVIVLIAGPKHTPPSTPGYVAPDHSEGFPDDRRVDVWALWTRKP